MTAIGGRGRPSPAGVAGSAKPDACAGRKNFGKNPCISGAGVVYYS